MACVLLGSLYVSSNEELRSHFDAVARALKPGGLYVLDWCVDFSPAVDICDTWEESQDGIVIIQDGVFKFLNPEMLRITGFSKDDALGRPFIDFVAHEFRGQVMDRYKKRMAGEEVESKYEIGVLRQEGDMVPVEVNASIIDFR